MKEGAMANSEVEWHIYLNSGAGGVFELHQAVAIVLQLVHLWLMGQQAVALEDLTKVQSKLCYVYLPHLEDAFDISFCVKVNSYNLPPTYLLSICNLPTTHLLHT